MLAETPLEVVNAATKVAFQDGSKAILVLNRFLLEDSPHQTESLLNPHQLCAHHVRVDDTAQHHTHVDGSPGAQCIVVEGTRLPLHFDGFKAYFSISRPTPSEFNTLPRYELTTDRPFDLQHERLYSCWIKPSGPLTVEEWRANLGYPTKEVTRATLQNTTQLVKTVEVESREMMHDHFTSRLLPLRPHQINDTCYTDTFFSSVRSIPPSAATWAKSKV